MDTIGVNLQAVKQRIAHAAKLCGRDPADVGLIAVAKAFGADAVAAAHAHGQYAFGENYVQEAVEKIAALAGVASPEGPLLRPLEPRIACCRIIFAIRRRDARGHSAGVASPEGPLLRPL